MLEYCLFIGSYLFKNIINHAIINKVLKKQEVVLYINLTIYH